MNSKEVAEIRRRFRVEKSAISHVRGAFVNDKGEILSRFDQYLGALSESEVATVFGTIKKALSGHIGRNLIDLSFSTAQVEKGEEHHLLTALRDTALKDDELVEKFYQKMISGIRMEGNYLIMVAYDSYDVFSRRRVMGEEQESTQQFRYIVSCVCPVKDENISLSYYLSENRLREIGKDAVVHAPEIGFLFPAFDDRATNIYGALYYTRDTGDSHAEFVEKMFNTPLPMPAKEQKGSFDALLSEALGDDLSLATAEAVQNEIAARIEVHREEKRPENLTLNVDSVADILQSCGIAEEKIAAFSEEYANTFGKYAELPPENIIRSKTFEVVTPKVHIKVDPEWKELLETRVIDGTKYILIRADETVDVNGVSIVIKE